MPHRVKNRHKPRHHAHKVKPANLSKPGLPPLVPPTATPAPGQPELKAPATVKKEHAVTDPVSAA